MGLQTPFFAKRDAESAGLRHNVPAPAIAARGAASMHALPTAVAQPSPPVEPARASGAVAPEPLREGGSKLTVGPNIKLKGVEITDCDTLLVEGLVEATMDSRLMQIAECGAFKGSAEIDIAEIRGRFDGTLTVRQRLVIHSTGRVTGKIRYGTLVAEEGAQISGEIGPVDAAPPGAVTRPALQAA